MNTGNLLGFLYTFEYVLGYHLYASNGFHGCAWWKHIIAEKNQENGWNLSYYFI